MIIHIIRPNETIEDIAEKYNLTIDEVKRANAHFRSWDNLAPGARISLPEIPQHVIDEIDSVEPFIEDYYPTIDIDNLKKIKTEEVNLVINEEISDNLVEEAPKKSFKKLNYNKFNYNNYYYPYYPYYDFYRKKYNNR